MAWFRMDDKFHSHLKVITAGNAAVGLFARAGCWCSDHSSDGVIPFPVARLLGKPKEIEALLAVGLWAKVDGGYVMPDFLEFNPSAEEVAERRAKRAEAGSQGGTKSGAVRRSKAEANTKQMLHDPFPDASNADEANTNPDPTRPDPTPRIQVSRQTDSLDTRNPVGLVAIALYAEEQQPTPGVRDVVKWRAGIARTVCAERWDEIAGYLNGHAAATPEQVAFHVLGVAKYAPEVREAWYANPHCPTCDGDGWSDHAPEEAATSAYGPCECRRPEPYLATVHPIGQTA